MKKVENTSALYHRITGSNWNRKLVANWFRSGPIPCLFSWVETGLNSDPVTSYCNCNTGETVVYNIVYNALMQIIQQWHSCNYITINILEQAILYQEIPRIFVVLGDPFVQDARGNTPPSLSVILTRLVVNQFSNRLTKIDMDTTIINKNVIHFEISSLTIFCLGLKRR